MVGKRKLVEGMVTEGNIKLIPNGRVWYSDYLNVFNGREIGSVVIVKTARLRAILQFCRRCGIMVSRKQIDPKTVEIKVLGQVFNEEGQSRLVKN